MVVIIDVVAVVIAVIVAIVHGGGRWLSAEDWLR